MPDADAVILNARRVLAAREFPPECEHGETKPHDFWPHDKPPRGRIVKPEWCPGPVAPQPQPEADHAG